MLGFNETRFAGWTVSDLTFLVAAVVVSVKLMSGRSRDLAPTTMRKASPPILVGTIVIVIAGTMSSFQSFEPVASILMVVRIVWITLAWFWVLRAVSPNRQTLHRLFVGFRFTVVASCLGALAGYFGLVSLTRENPENREAAFFNHPNELGGLIAMAIPFIVLGVLQGTADQPGTRAKRVALTILAVMALGTSGSMTSFLSTVASTATIFVVQALTRGKGAGRRLRNPLPYLLGAMALVGGLLWLAGSGLPVVERFTELGSGGENVSQSIGSREDVNSYVVNNFDNWLVVGAGLDANTSFVETDLQEGVASVHNLYLKLLYEAGVPGLTGLIIVLATAFRQAWRLVINTRNDPLYPTAVALLASLVSVVVFAQFQPLFAQRYFWLPIGLIGVLWSLRRQEQAEAHATGVT